MIAQIKFSWNIFKVYSVNLRLVPFSKQILLPALYILTPDDNSEVGTHVLRDLGYLSYLRHLF